MFRNKAYVLAVWREGSFSRAAEQLYVSQPSLSATVKRIEEKIAAPIFDRSTSPVTLTAVGEEYVRYALEIEQKERDFSRFTSDYAHLMTGSVKVGGSSLFSSFMLPRMISRFNRKHPGISFEISEDNSKDLIQRLQAGALDLVMDNTPMEDEGILARVCTSEMLLLAVPRHLAVNEGLAEYRLTAKEIKANVHQGDVPCVSLAAFRNEPFIFLNSGNDTGSRAQLLFCKHGLKPNVIFYLDQQVTAFNISCTGMGISFVSDTLIKHIDAEPALDYYRLADPEIVRNIYIYTKRNRYLSLACRRFIEENAAETAEVVKAE